MRSQVAGESLGVAYGALGHTGHVAGDTILDMRVKLEILSLLEVTILTLSTRGLGSVAVSQLNHAGMRVVADDAVNRDVLALEELLILLVMPDESAAGVDLFHNAPEVAGAAGLSISINLHT